MQGPGTGNGSERVNEQIRSGRGQKPGDLKFFSGPEFLRLQSHTHISGGKLCFTYNSRLLGKHGHDYAVSWGGGTV